MSLKRNIAGISALGIIGALSLTAVSSLNNNDNTANAAAKFGDINSDGYIDAVDASIILKYYSYASTCEGTPTALEEFMKKNTDTTEPSTTDKKISLKTGGETFTILSWSDTDIPNLISSWRGIYEGDIIKYFNSPTDYDITAPSGAKINFINVNSAGSYASEYYDEIFNQGDDVDVYFVEPYWALNYMDNDKLSAPLSDIGITEDDMSEWYPYTKKLAKNSNGVLKSVPYNIAPGAFVYRSDLAEEYLGVKTSEEMQAAIGDWDKFSGSAKTIAEKSEGKVALADSLGGMWEAFSCGRFDFTASGNISDLSNDVKYFADMAKGLWNVGGVARNAQWTDEWQQAGQKSLCMGYFVPSWAFFYNDSFVCEATSKQPGNWSICVGPQAYCWGGNDIIVNPSTDNGDDVRSFILSSAFNSENMKRLAYFDNMPNNMSANAQLAKDNLWHDTKMIDILNAENYYAIFDQSARKIDMKSYSSYDETIKSDIIEAIKDSYIDIGQSWDDTMKAIQDEINKIKP
ncbi:hypothetical protein [Ruminococcus flavefaciens]|uniref:hypothetical protein n=1 Tax=Ruminococcus flavefaciens TaxID=1265 RepID=UPI00048B7682|nr:hypothetical protein [Ruminococcus flavefaciens]